MQMQELTVDDILRVIVEHQDTIDLLQGNIITRARLLQYTQTQYEALVTLAKQSIELISNIREGDTIGPEWAVTRDQIIAKAQRLIEDAYGKGIQE